MNIIPHGRDLSQLNNDHLNIFPESLAKAVSNNDIALVESIIKHNLLGFKEALRHKDKDGNTLIALAVKMNHIEMLKLMIHAAPHEVNSALIVQNKDGHTPVALAVAYNLYDHLSLMYDQAPDEFRCSLLIPANDGFTPVGIAVCTLSYDIFNFIAKVAYKELNEALVLQDNDGNTPIIAAVLNFKMLQLVANVAPEAFEKGLVIQNAKGDTAVSLSVKDFAALKFIKDVAPKAFNQAASLRDAHGLSLLDVIRRARIKNYNQIITLFEKNSAARILNKEIVRRKALGHAWNMSGITAVTSTDKKITVNNIRLEGWLAPQWFHMFGKDLDKFKSLYPDLLTKKEMEILKDALDLGANPTSYTLEEKLKQIKSGKLTISSASYIGHEVTLLIWGNKFAICNRGEASRKPIEYFTFDLQKFEIDVLRKILSLDKGTQEEYEKLLFEILPAKLKFVKTDVDALLEENSKSLTPQSVGNCSFVSPVTSIFAARMLNDTYGTNENGELLSKHQHKGSHKAALSNETVNILSENMEKAKSWFQTWLPFEQITILERSIMPLQDEKQHFEPDHVLIQRSLCKAHLLQLDKLSSTRLSDLTEIYLNSLEQQEQTELKTDMVFWDMVKHMRTDT